MKKLTTLLWGILAAAAALSAQAPKNVFWFDHPAAFWEAVKGATFAEGNK